MEPLRHLLVLCCYGGQPFMDFHSALRHQIHQIDPTDWMAEDIAGSLLENSSLSSLPMISSVLASGVSLSDCDLFNVSFSSTADEAVYDKYKAELVCRCPASHSGVSCEIARPVSLAQLSSSAVHSDSILPMPMLIVFAAVLLAIFVCMFMMVKGCFCDCFGPFRHSGEDDPYDKPLDPEDVQKCLAKYRAHEARQEMLENGVAATPRYFHSAASTANEQQHPLIATISDGGCAPYNNTVIPSAPPPPRNVHYRPPSPPPSYSSVAGSTDRLPTTQI